MSKEKETDAANVLSQMSQLVSMPPFDLPASLSPVDNEDIIETDAIGATCTLQPSNLGQLFFYNVFMPYSIFVLEQLRKLYVFQNILECENYIGFTLQFFEYKQVYEAKI